jgi:hypothetical protein
MGRGGKPFCLLSRDRLQVNALSGMPVSPVWNSSPRVISTPLASAAQSIWPFMSQLRERGIVIGVLFATPTEGS